MESRTSVVLFVSLTSLAACQSRTPTPEPDLAIRAAVGVDQPIALRVEGLPVDEPEVAGDALSLAEALSLCLESSPEIQAALARVRTALAAADQARLLPNPLLEFVLRFPEGGGQADLEVGVATDLLAILRRDRAAAIADQSLSAAVSAAVETSVAAAAEVQERYATVRALDELLPLLFERRTGMERLVSLARSRLEFGEGSRIELTTLEARASEIEVEILEKESESRDERLALARRIGRPSDAAQWTLETRPEVPAAIADEELWITLALEHRAELQACRWRLAALGIEAESADASVWQGLEVGVRAERADSWSVGPTVSAPLPLFDDGSVRREWSEARVLEARFEFTRLQRAVVEDVRRAIAAHRTALASLARVRDELIPLQRSRLEQVGAAQRAGVLDVGAVLLAEQDLQAARTKLVEAEKRAFLSLVRLEHAVGGAGVARRVGEWSADS